MQIILKPDFEDVISVKCSNDKIDMNRVLLVFFFSEPILIKILMTMRNWVVGLWGLKTSQLQKNVVNDHSTIKEGDTIGLFEIGAISNQRVIMGANDSHLDFRVIMILEGDNLHCKTQVQFNNALGKWYFFFIKPFHKFIVPMMLRNTIKNL